jgi:hypothetical protein
MGNQVSLIGVPTDPPSIRNEERRRSLSVDQLCVSYSFAALSIKEHDSLKFGAGLSMRQHSQRN